MVKLEKEIDYNIEKLLRCPFCSSMASCIYDVRSGFMVECTKCGLRTKDFDRPSKAYSSWNLRNNKIDKTSSLECGVWCSQSSMSSIEKAKEEKMMPIIQIIVK